ncbi:hypothetical protein Hypma_014427 [Hypsizygus marmoreus]|uniref:Uncharacterized protein n=1 Tax=Hypsizygus marmoreus TaxID=39966 RepID=A0A369JAG6_HYPMA|nr:hypothetical protein Hypma_014427 [Hypsizygus marmoreus]
MYLVDIHAARRYRNKRVSSLSTFVLDDQTDAWKGWNGFVGREMTLKYSRRYWDRGAYLVSVSDPHDTQRFRRRLFLCHVETGDASLSHDVALVPLHPPHSPMPPKKRTITEFSARYIRCTPLCDSDSHSYRCKHRLPRVLHPPTPFPHQHFVSGLGTLTSHPLQSEARNCLHRVLACLFALSRRRKLSTVPFSIRCFVWMMGGLWCVISLILALSSSNITPRQCLHSP